MAQSRPFAGRTAERPVSREPARDYSRLDGTAFERTAVAGLTAVVVGAGALGNEVLKNLALMGIGRIVVVDRDRVERSNLTRSVLYCAPDIEQHLEAGTPKAAFAARRVADLNPDVTATAVVGEIADLGLGVLRRANVVFGCLDNEMARVELSWAAVRADRVLVDGGLGNMNPSSGMVLVFPGRSGPCAMCRKTAERRRALLWELQGREDPCWLKERGLAEAGMVATTPVMASIIGALQVELGLRRVLAKPDAGTETAPLGHAHRVVAHPGPTLDSRAFERSPSCPLHEPETLWQTVEERPDRRSTSWRVADLLGETGGTSLQLDWPITSRAACRACGQSWEPLVRRARFRGQTCPACASVDVVETDVIDSVSVDSPLAGRSLAELGLPSAHVHEIVGERAGEISRRFVEVTGDLMEGGAPC
jgi:adenylyltransferase/sulfurtransferase